MTNDQNNTHEGQDGWNVLDENLSALLSGAYSPAEPEAEFVAQTLALMQQEARGRQRRVGAWRGVAMAAAAAVVLAVGVFLVRSIGRIPGPVATTPLAATSGDSQAGDSTAGMVQDQLTARPAPAGLPAAGLAIGQAVSTGPREQRRLALPDGSTMYVDAGTNLQVTGRRSVKLSAGRVYVEVAPDRESPLTLQTPDRTVTALGTRLAVEVAGGKTGVWVTQGKVAIDGVSAPLYAGEQLLPSASTATAMPRATAVLDWTKDLVAASASPLVPATKNAGGALTVVGGDGQEFRLELRKFHVDVHIEDGFARTTIDQTYFNHTSQRLEGTFYFPLPADASLSRLAMYVAGTRMEGGMVEREEARGIFESIVRRMKDPALLEWVDGTTFKMRVFPLEGRQEKRIILSYTQKLASLYDKKAYRFPAGHSLGKVADWSLNVRVKNAAGWAWECPSHALTAGPDGGDLVLKGEGKNVVLDKDVVVSIRERAADGGSAARFSTFEQDGAKYLMVRYRPELPTTKRTGRTDWTFLVETSADRDELLARTQIEVVRGMLEAAEHTDTFNVVTAGTRARVFAQAPVEATKENIAKAVEFMERAHLIGALDLGNALGVAEGLRNRKRGDRERLVHVGTGNAVLGTRDQKELIQKIGTEWEYVGIGVGKTWNRAFMREAAARTGGYFTQINPDEDVKWRAMDTMAALNASRLMAAAATADDTPMLAGTDAVSAGEELWAIIRLDKDAAWPESVIVHGQLDGKVFSQRLAVKKVSEGAGYLPRTWARLEIDRLLAGDARANREKIVALSKSTYVMSPFTSLLVLENEAMYTQYHVDRGRKDHWAMYDCPETITVVTEPRYSWNLARPQSVAARPGDRKANAPPGWFGSETRTVGRGWGDDARGSGGSGLRSLGYAGDDEGTPRAKGEGRPVRGWGPNAPGPTVYGGAAPAAPATVGSPPGEGESRGRSDRIAGPTPPSDDEPGQRRFKVDASRIERDRLSEGSREDARESAIPWYYEITYPRDWREKTAGRGNLDELTHQTLRATKVNADFAGEELSLVVDYLRQTTGVAIHVRWRVLESAGITSRTPITMRLANVTAEQALCALLSKLGAGETRLTYLAEDGLIIISTAMDLKDRVALPGKQAMAAVLMDQAVDAAGPTEQGMPAMAAALHYVYAQRWDMAERQLGELLSDARCGENSALWRAGAMVAGMRGLTAVGVTRLDRALDIEYRREGGSAGLREIRGDYARLLAGYQELAKAVAGMKDASAPLAGGVVRAADRWRTMDPDVTPACQAAARALTTLGETELAWEYLTTPLADATKGARPWLDLAAALANQGQADLAARACAAAAQIEPGDPRILWEYAELLWQIGRADEARTLYSRIAGREWGRQYEQVRAAARDKLQEKRR